MKTNKDAKAKVWAAPTLQVVIMSAAKYGDVGDTDGNGEGFYS